MEFNGLPPIEVLFEQGRMPLPRGMQLDKIVPTNVAVDLDLRSVQTSGNSHFGATCKNLSPRHSSGSCNG